MPKIRMNIEFSESLARFLEELAEHEETTKIEIIRRSLSVMKAYKEQRELGRKHIGFTSKPDSLETEIVGVLDK